MAYATRLEAKPWERDKIFAAHGARLLVDPKPRIAAGTLERRLWIGLEMNEKAGSSLAAAKSYALEVRKESGDKQLTCALSALQPRTLANPEQMEQALV